MSAPSTLQVGTIAAAAVFALLAGAWLNHVINRAWRRLRLRMRFRHAAKGEEHARNYLKKKGFRIVSEQARQKAEIWVDGERKEYEVRADFLVERKGRSAVVEVKTGKSAPNPTHADTRRQLYEYAMVYDVDALYLFDADTDRLDEIRFKHHNPAKSTFPWWLVPIALVAGLILGLLWR